MQYLYPEPLKPGDTIGLVTPSSPMIPDILEVGIAYLQQKGFQVKLGQHVHAGDRFLAGDDEFRAKDIMDFFRDDEVKVIMAIAGGYGSQRIIPLLDYDLIRTRPKYLSGFSDTTALQVALLKKVRMISCTGFVFGDLGDGQLDSLIEKTLWTCLAGGSFQIKEGQTVQPGIAKGRLVGGNLEALTSLMGTPYQPEIENSILLLEDVGAEPYQVDSRLSQLDMAGVFSDAQGVIFGQFARCVAKYFPERDGIVDDVIEEWSLRIKVPCIKNFPYGHFPRRCVLPLGKEVILEADQCLVTIL
ncbi:S66 peptidase family protein [Legionella parisiensis]|uniref:Putative murein peptide carboxypeptidase n=1 Tax=Legionella parisiensis TaxID=45071 RepID=A0A1E5JSD3_9GAMM|nr:LD-carboxypeptidase [Legionella parisiensis]KTD42180.1 muramoyltetrapeptide carboxypeptidase [Legionella parisiensis]OEH47441.1 putative murein peptide carboxypeptidase [Legionella parisiensis]STX75227.1 muramoyltetrapeptide carboxypeptidase [Legionella parisiensis]